MNESFAFALRKRHKRIGNDGILLMNARTIHAFHM
jgi:hypothetical protein